MGRTTATAMTMAVTIELNIVVVVAFLSSTIIAVFDANCSGVERFCMCDQRVARSAGSLESGYK